MNTLEAPRQNNINVGVLYDQFYREYVSKNDYMRPALGEAAQRFLGELEKPGTILDIGCGHGRDADFFTRRGFDVVGIDPSKKLTELARSRTLARIETIGILEFEAPSFSFDGAWASASLHHLGHHNLKIALAKIKRVLRPDGCFFASFKEGSSEGEELDSYTNKTSLPVSRYGLEELTQIFTKIGFEVFHSEQSHGWVRIFAKSR